MNDKASTTIANRRVALGIVILLTAVSGVVHGYLDGRWSDPTDLKQIGQRLDDLPDSCGDWVLTELSELPKGAANLLRCYGSSVRIYRHQTTGAVINVAVMFGPRGPIAVHTPEVCYDSVGTSQVGETRSESITTTNGRHHFWVAQFAHDPSPDPSFEVWYAWSNGGKWQAADYPRFWLTDNLYKIQLAGSPGVESEQPCRDFLDAFLPHLENVVGS